jgi:hypothetical protein
MDFQDVFPAGDLPEKENHRHCPDSVPSFNPVAEYPDRQCSRLPGSTVLVIDTLFFRVAVKLLVTDSFRNTSSNVCQS